MPLAMVVNKAIEFDPAKRYQTPGDMLADLKLAMKRVKRPPKEATSRPNSKAAKVTTKASRGS